MISFTLSHCLTRLARLATKLSIGLKCTYPTWGGHLLVTTPRIHAPRRGVLARLENSAPISASQSNIHSDVPLSSLGTSRVEARVMLHHLFFDCTGDIK